MVTVTYGTVHRTRDRTVPYRTSICVTVKSDTVTRDKLVNYCTPIPKTTVTE